MDAPAGAPQPSSKMSGFSLPKTPPAVPKFPLPTPPPPGYVAPDLTAEDARALAAEGITGEETEALQAMQDKQARAQLPEDKALSYEERVKLFGLDINDALVIIDALTTTGEYEEEIRISKSNSVLFTIRSVRFNSWLADKIDIADPRKVGKLNQLMAEYQVAASLKRYNKLDMPVLDDDANAQDWEKALMARMAFIKHLPSPVFMLLTNKLAKFDAKMMVVFSEGYEQNF